VVAPAPAAVTIPPTLIAKVDQLSAAYKQAQEMAAKGATLDATNVEEFAKYQADSQALAAKMQTLALEIATAQAQLTPEQNALFIKDYQSKLIPLTPALPAAPASPPANP